jgi:hypothetical protein
MFYDHKNRSKQFFQFEPECQLHAGSIFGATFPLTQATPATAHYLSNKYSFIRTCGAHF